MYGKVIQLHVHTYPFVFRFFPTWVVTAYGAEFSVLSRRSALVVCFLCSGMCMFTSSSRFPPRPAPVLDRRVSSARSVL